MFNNGRPTDLRTGSSGGCGLPVEHMLEASRTAARRAIGQAYTLGPPLQRARDRPESGGQRVKVSLKLAARPESAGEARRAVASVLGESRLDELRDSALLLTSELVTNAILHARTDLDMIVVVEPPRVRVEVYDDEHSHPEMRDATDSETSGRGLMLVEILSAAWGVKQHEGGKCVWFEVA